MKLLFLIMMTILAPGIAHSNREIDNAWILVYHGQVEGTITTIH